MANLTEINSLPALIIFFRCPNKKAGEAIFIYEVIIGNVITAKMICPAAIVSIFHIKHSITVTNITFSSTYGTANTEKRVW